MIAISVEYLLWILPVLVAVSLVLAATRHERTDLILSQAWRSGLWTVCFLGIVAALIRFAIWRIG
ncbi:MAG: hypothetical protein KGQ51_13950 [Planctomycetes bacterium]|jgi:hypothetical protein|nr:hypothetical protein [Planctomycetota bacterium]